MSRSSGFLVPLILLVPLFSYGEAASIPKTLGQTCGYEACPATDPKKLNIHLVAHTHDDVGWLKTVDQYYFGSQSRIQLAGVQYILDSVVQALLADPHRKFIYVETAFLWKWWQRQSSDIRENVEKLINEGRLEIINGAWSMNDEAVTHYHSIVDQYTWGFRRLSDTFGSCARPRVGWQIDPFGHSREQASLLAQFGFDGMFFGRLDYQDKRQRVKDKTMEFIWKGSPNLGSRANLFTGVLYNTYNAPPGFCFDILCNDDPIIDDPESPDYNVKERVEKFVSYAHEQASAYKTNNVIFTMGQDFTYQQAEVWFTNLDKLIRFVREQRGSDVNIFYSTPSCYLKALHDAQLRWPTKSDDFFPYASDPHSYWTGYFSSRPTIKFFERMGNNLLQITKQLHVLAGLEGFGNAQLENFREAMGVMQHHDAVTGTEKQLVADDYARILHESMQQGLDIVTNAMSTWKTNGQPGLISTLNSCLQLNISACPNTEDENFILTIYNPLSHKIWTPIRIPVQYDGYTTVDLVDGTEIVSQIVPIPDSVLEIPGRESKATGELVFLAAIQALGFTSYKITRKSSTQGDGLTNTSFIGNEFYNVSVNDHGQIVLDWKKQKDMSLTQSFHYYEGMEGNNEIAQNRSSGAYIFRPKGISSKNFVKPTSFKVYKGPVVQEIHQVVDDYVSQVIRVYTGKEYVEFNWLVGPIPVKDKIGKEIITKYTSNLNSSGEFYTDANGREMLKRKRNNRSTWDLELEEEISGNYYPVTSKISLRDEAKFLKLSVLTDRAEGGTSMQDGEIELMVHRRLLRDDAFGVGEALNESAYGEGLVVRGSHYVLGDSIPNLDDLAMKEKALALQLLLRPWPLITPLSSGDSIAKDSPILPQRSGLTKILPPNVHILTLEPWKDGTILLRLEHIFELGETESFSKPVEINIADLFSSFTIRSIEETTLGGNQLLKDLYRFNWKPESNNVLQTEETPTSSVTNVKGVINVVLNPMQIRTFVITIEPK